MKSALEQMSAPHYDTVFYLLQHLRRVADLSSVNKMAASNLGIVFGPTLMMPPPDMSMEEVAHNMLQQNLLVKNLIINLDGIS